MRITRSKIVEMIQEEVRGRILELLEDEDEKKGKKPETASADDEPTRPKKDPGPSGAKASPGAPDQMQAAVDAEAQDDAEEDEQDAIDPSGDAAQDPSGAVNDEISGKTVQAISIEPKSKVLPGAKEVILSFNESTDTLRILCTGTGQVKFFYRGQLHDLP